MHISRLPDWQLRLEAFVNARRSTPFAWGTNDCGIFAADCVLALTGTDPAPKGMREHRTAKQAARAVNRRGGLMGIATAAFGPAAPAVFAHVGDVVLVNIGKRQALAICNGSTAIGPSEIGMACVSMDCATVFWRVP